MTVRLAVIACFLNEQRFLGTFLASVASQTRPPDELLMVDDGSSDDSALIAERFAGEHAYARVLQRPRRPPEHDRLASAAEFIAFDWALQRLARDWDVVVKLDADLLLTTATFADILERLVMDPRMGVAGPYLSIGGPGASRRQRCPARHVHGPAKFYRRACWFDIAPLPATLGWDTIDEVTARLRGWQTGSFPVSTGDPIHLRAPGSYDGRYRGQRRHGAAAYGFGAHPLWIIAGAIRRAREPPRGIGGLAYAWGYGQAAFRGAPRAQREVRREVRRHELRQLATVAGRLGRP